MPEKKIKAPEQVHASLSYEDAMARLEGIVESMDGDRLPLEDLISQYQVGNSLLKHCETILESARKRVELITLSTESAPSGSRKPAPASEAVDPDDENDIRLF